MGLSQELADCQTAEVSKSDLKFPEIGA